MKKTFTRHYVEIAFMKKWTLSIIVSLLLGTLSYSQNIPIGTWRTHYSYTQARILSASKDKIFCAAQNGLFSYDLSDQSLNEISKINGLSDAGISSMAYSEESAILVVGYQSGLIDLIYESEVFSIRDIRNLREDFDKEIFDIEIHDGFAYAATNIGIIVISLRENTIVDNFKSIGVDAEEVSVFNLMIADGNLYAVTSAGIQFGSLSKNLLDFNNWSRLNTDPVHTFDNLTQSSGEVFMIHNDSLLSRITLDTVEVVTNVKSEIKKIRSLDNGLGILTDKDIFNWSNSSLDVVKTFSNINKANDFIENGDIWIASEANGLLDNDETTIVPNGPKSDNITNIKLISDKLFSFYGSAPEEFNGTYDSLGYDSFDDGLWNNVPLEGFYNIVDGTDFNGEIYLASLGMGLYKQSDGVILNETNSPLQKNASNAILISAISSGRSLWVTSYNSNLPLHQLSQDDQWTSFTASEVSTSSPKSIDISQGETLWITRGEGNLIMLNSENEQIRLITTSSGIPSPFINDIELDVNDEAWIATNQGIVNFLEATFISEEIDGSELVFEDETVYTSLNVSAVSSDGGGRVWVAGKDHIAVYNNNLTKRFFLFDEENSPLPSSEILKLEYNPSNGEMFILTTRGLVSYRSNSSRENSKHTGVSIFPNPVRPNYTGEVGIKGVVSNADIKITDINGKLIQQVNAFGGTASWNLRDYNNSRVQSGIYLIFSADTEGTETFVGKIAVLY
ncbi:MAG: T9SS type A sorting domain-containing protein [Cyclobacteriaceae bacterium]